jgi:hypothetical protein
VPRYATICEALITHARRGHTPRGLAQVVVRGGFSSSYSEDCEARAEA